MQNMNSNKQVRFDSFEGLLLIVSQVLINLVTYLYHCVIYFPTCVVSLVSPIMSNFVT